MIFTPGERRLIALLIVFLGSAYLISGLRACRLLPDPAAGREARAGEAADRRLAPRDEPLDEPLEDRRHDSSAERADSAGESSGDEGREDPATGSPRAGGPPAADERGVFAGGYLDLNAADSLALVALPGIGPALAGRILAMRAQRGRFERVEELLDVRGIGEKRLDQLRAYLIVSAPAR